MGDELSPQEQLQAIAIKILEKDFSDKPTYNQITSQSIINPQINYILSRISDITKYFLINVLYAYVNSMKMQLLSMKKILEMLNHF